MKLFRAVAAAIPWTQLALQSAVVVVSLVIAAITAVSSGRATVLLFGSLAVITALLAALDSRRTYLPCVVVSWLVVQFLFATSTASLGERVAGAAGEVAGLWLLYTLFSLRESLPRRGVIHRELLVRWAVRYATTVAVSVPVAVVVVSASALPPSHSWFRVLGPLAAVALLGVIALILWRQAAE